MTGRPARRPSQRPGRVSVPRVSVTGAQIRAARALLKMSQRDLSRLSHVSNLTIVRMEATDGLVARRAKLVASIVSALSRRGIEFLSSGRFGVGVRLKPSTRGRH